MKKLILFACLAVSFTAVLPSLLKTNEAKSQIVTTLTPIAANDTLTNADTAYVYICTSATHSKTFSASNSVADNISRSVTLKVTKVSGTVAGTATFAGSNDGSNWETISSAYTITNTTGDQVKTFAMRTTSDLLFTYYRMEIITSGTQVSIPKVLFNRRSN